jgi:hypothetical protein
LYLSEKREVVPTPSGRGAGGTVLKTFKGRGIPFHARNILDTGSTKIPRPRHQDSFESYGVEHEVRRSDSDEGNVVERGYVDMNGWCVWNEKAVESGWTVFTAEVAFKSRKGLDER